MPLLAAGNPYFQPRSLCSCLRSPKQPTAVSAGFMASLPGKRGYARRLDGLQDRCAARPSLLRSANRRLQGNGSTAATTLLRVRQRRQVRHGKGFVADNPPPRLGLRRVWMGIRADMGALERPRQTACLSHLRSRQGEHPVRFDAADHPAGLSTGGLGKSRAGDSQACIS